MAKIPNPGYIYKDDLTGEEVKEEDFETIEFTYGGTSWTIDLSKANVKKMDDALAPFIDAATLVRRGGSTSSAKAKSSTNRAGARKWAEEQGLVEKGGRGRLSNDILKKYDEAHA
ncbi:Lsr2 family protein [Microbacterium sp. cx-55]|uniref:Lsr2 dimerization domain-containing protein n=1 Tax=Microbacterium sp. cx-55 TaxID=2875948 RepID=UPI001CBFC900|nr:histone-like nucleoid-structuring protein Lsr2 [Microbacterium sp. cx-55]MBZ4485985.1 Lsr2 family protein [Microbacterium sp. cx-55]UGB34141.1 Lsr2 family protein [Microbacterium sp. cx-55]